jgi:site-specific recombinase XerD
VRRVVRSKRAHRLAGIQDITWHCLRHRFASRLVMAGVDLRTVQELIERKSIQMTCRFAHLGPRRQLAAVKRLGKLPESLQTMQPDTRTDTGESKLSEPVLAFAS